MDENEDMKKEIRELEEEIYEMQDNFRYIYIYTQGRERSIIRSQYIARRLYCRWALRIYREAII